MPFRYRIFLVLMGVVSFCFGQDSTQTKQKKVNFSGIVLPSRSPENGFYAQGDLVGIYKTQLSDSTLRASNTYLYGMYSQLHQWRISIGGDIFTPKEKYYVNFWYYSSFVPEKYFGLGNEVKPDTSEFVSYSVWYANTNVLKKISKNNFAGLVHTFEQASATNSESNGLFEKTKPTGNEGYLVNGLGILLRHDSRDYLLSANKGMYAEFSFRQFAPILLSKYTFSAYKLDLRKFITLGKKERNILAFQFVHQGADGEIPLRFLPSVSTRAYHPNLYRGNFSSWLQAEYRLRIWKWVGASFFGGMAQANNSLSGIDSAPLRPNYGMGLRFKLIPKHNMNLRIEYGIGQNTSNYYVAFYDAF